jgi:hypothetical protein
MDFKDLNLSERASLVALLRTCVMADGSVNEAEESAFDLLVQLLGEDSYREAAAMATERAQDQESLLGLLAEVHREEARELIYGTLLQVATSETINASESAILDMVGEAWNIQPKFEEFPAD